MTEYLTCLSYLWKHINVPMIRQTLLKHHECFSGRLEKQDCRPSLLLADMFSTSRLKPLNRIQRNLTGSKISTASNKFVFFRSIGKRKWPSGL